MSTKALSAKQHTPATPSGTLICPYSAPNLRNRCAGLSNDVPECLRQTTQAQCISCHYMTRPQTLAMNFLSILPIAPT